MLQKIWKVIKSILFLGLVAAVIYGVTILTLPKIPDFYAHEEWDVVFFGTSQSYCSFDPAIFDEYGLKTYNRGRQQQTMNYTYYYIKDALEVCEIDTIVLEVFGMFYDEDDERFEDELIRESSLGDFRYSEIKLEAIKDCVPEETQFQYLMPLDKYHTNWEKWDFSSLDSFKRTVLSPYYKESSDRGYMRWTAAAEFYYPLEYVNSYYYEEVYKENIRYLEMILDMCRERGIRLILVRTPIPCYEMVVGKTNTIKAWAEMNGVEMLNFMELTKEIGFDSAVDSLDEGVHLNAAGASKVSRYLAEYIMYNKKVAIAE